MFYLNIFADLFEIYPVPPPPQPSTKVTRAITDREPGLMGFLAAAMELMPLEVWSEIVLREWETNEHLQAAVAAFQGDEARAIVEELEQMPEVLELKESLRSLGVPIDCALYRLQTVLGWSPNPCACWASEADVSGTTTAATTANVVAGSQEEEFDCSDFFY